MSRYDAYRAIDKDLPIQEHEINDFVKASKARDNGHDDNTQDR